MSKKAIRKNSVVNYPLGDFLIRVKNAVMAGNRVVEVKNTKLVKSTAVVLKKMGYLDSVSVKDGLLVVSLAFRKKEPIMLGLKLVSKPGLRIYMDVAELEKKKGPSSYVLSTSKGLMRARDAVKSRIGGEVIVEVW